MTLLEILTDEHDEFLKFENVKEKRAERPELHALLVLSELDQGADRVISWACYYKIFLSFDAETVLSKITEDQALDLIRCGVAYDWESESFYIEF